MYAELTGGPTLATNQTSIGGEFRVALGGQLDLFVEGGRVGNAATTDFEGRGVRIARRQQSQQHRDRERVREVTLLRTSRACRTTASSTRLVRHPSRHPMSRWVRVVVVKTGDGLSRPVDEYRGHLLEPFAVHDVVGTADGVGYPDAAPFEVGGRRVANSAALDEQIEVGAQPPPELATYRGV